MKYEGTHLSDEIRPAAIRTGFALGIAVLSLISLNIVHPSFAKGFDVPLAVLLLAAVYVQPRLALISGVAAGIICDLYAGRLDFFHTVFYSLPGAMIMFAGEGVLLRSNSVAAGVLFGLIALKFVLQYLLLFVNGHGDWPTALFQLNWWGAFVLIIVAFGLWNKAGVWLSAKPDSVRFRRGVYGR